MISGRSLLALDDERRQPRPACHPEWALLVEPFSAGLCPFVETLLSKIYCEENLRFVMPLDKILGQGFLEQLITCSNYRIRIFDSH